MSPDEMPKLVPRSAPEGVVPLIAVEGEAYDCGRHYAEIVLEKYPGFREYLDMAWAWRSLPREEQRLVEERAPYLLDLHRGLTEAAGPPPQAPPAPARGGCTSFGLSGSVTLDGGPISGQTKDTPLNRIPRYIVLRMRLRGGPSLLVLAYPGEVLGYGFWSTGMSIFRNSLFSTAGAERGLSFWAWGLLALAGPSVHEAVELAQKHGMKGAGNALLCDAQGESLSVEHNAGGIGIVPAKDGIATHANHPEAPATRPFAQYSCETAKDDSMYRMHGLWKLLNAERERLTAQRAMMLLADHGAYPRGICKHWNEDGNVTTAAVVVEPAAGRLHVARGQPCCNWPVTYSL